MRLLTLTKPLRLLCCLSHLGVSGGSRPSDEESVLIKVRTLVYHLPAEGGYIFDSTHILLLRQNVMSAVACISTSDVPNQDALHAKALVLSRFRRTFAVNGVFR